MKYFKYIIVFLIFNFSIIGDYSNVRYNPSNYLRATESVFKQVSKNDFNKTYFWNRTPIKNINFQFYIISFKNHQIYLLRLVRLKFLNQSKILEQIDIIKKKYLKLNKLELSIENITDLYKSAGFRIDSCYLCNKLHVLKISNFKFQIFQKCINQTINPIGFFEISKLFSIGLERPST